MSDTVVEVEAADTVVALAIRERFGDAVEPTGAPDLLVRFERVDELPAPRARAGERDVYEPRAGRVSYREVGDVLLMDHEDDVLVRCSPEAGLVDVRYRGSPAPHLWYLSHPAITLPLLECAKRRGSFPVHAAGVAGPGGVVLLAGTSGAGKTTTALALVHAGWWFLGEDLVFLRSQGRDDLVVTGFNDAVDVTEGTIDLIDALRPLRRRRRPAGWPKWSFRIEELFPCRVVCSGRPRALVFPEVAPDGDSGELRPVDHDEAFRELLPNALLTEQRSTSEHVEVLARLAYSVPAFRLRVGPDLAALPGLLSSLA